MAGEHDDQALALARIEVKIDTLIAANSDHESRIRVLEGRENSSALGARITNIEKSGFVTGRQLWTGLVGSATLTSAIIAAVALLTR